MLHRALQIETLKSVHKNGVQYNSSALFDVRELIHLRRLEDRQEVKSIYISLFKCVLKDGANFPYSYRDEKHPLEHWWFDKIADKSYLAELLSEHLMEFYLKAF